MSVRVMVALTLPLVVAGSCETAHVEAPTSAARDPRTMTCVATDLSGIENAGPEIGAELECLLGGGRPILVAHAPRMSAFGVLAVAGDSVLLAADDPSNSASGRASSIHALTRSASGWSDRCLFSTDFGLGIGATVVRRASDDTLVAVLLWKELAGGVPRTARLTHRIEFPSGTAQAIAAEAVRDFASSSETAYRDATGKDLLATIADDGGFLLESIAPDGIASIALRTPPTTQPGSVPTPAVSLLPDGDSFVWFREASTAGALRTGRTPSPDERTVPGSATARLGLGLLRGEALRLWATRPAGSDVEFVSTRIEVDEPSGDWLPGPTLGFGDRVVFPTPESLYVLGGPLQEYRFARLTGTGGATTTEVLIPARNAIPRSDPPLATLSTDCPAPP